MRNLALGACGLTTALAGCLGAPTGLPADASVDAPTDARVVDATPMTWPPPAPQVLAIAAGPVDGDAIDDLVVVDAASDKVYLLKGGVDVAATTSAVTSYSESFTIADLEGPAAALVVNFGEARVVVLDNPQPGPRITILKADLSLSGTSPIAMAQRPPADSVVSLNVSPFGMNNASSVFISLPTSMHFIEGAQVSASPPMIVPPGTLPAGTPTTIRAVGAYRSPGPPPAPRAFISELGAAQRANANGAAWTWSSLRTGNDWPAQTVTDLGGDQLLEVVGYENGAPDGKLCVLAVETMATGCAGAGVNLPNVQIVVGGVVTAAQRDVVILDGNNPQGVFVAADLRMNGSTVMVEARSLPRDMMVPSPRMALAQLDGAGGQEILVVGANGVVKCSRYSGGLGAPIACAP